MGPCVIPDHTDPVERVTWYPTTWVCTRIHWMRMKTALSLALKTALEMSARGWLKAESIVEYPGVAEKSCSFYRVVLPVGEDPCSRPLRYRLTLRNTWTTHNATQRLPKESAHPGFPVCLIENWNSPIRANYFIFLPQVPDSDVSGTEPRQWRHSKTLGRA